MKDPVFGRRKKALFITALTAIILTAFATFLISQPGYAGGEDQWFNLELAFAKVDENGSLMTGASFKLVDPDGNDISYEHLYTVTNSSTQTIRITDLRTLFVYNDTYNLKSDFYVKLIEEAPDGYEPIDPIIIKLEPSSTYDSPTLMINDYKITSTISGSTNVFFGTLNDPEGVINQNTRISTAYKTSDPVKAHNANPANFLIVNYRQISIVKKDDAGNYVKGAVLEITGKTNDNTTIKPIRFTSEDKVSTKGLPAGTYKLTEIETPAGYLPADPIDFTLAIDGKITIDGKEVSEIEMIDPKIPPEKNPKLSIRKTSNVTKAKIGDVIPFIITVTNSGDGDASEIIVLDTMGRDLEYVSDDTNGSVSGNKVEWTIDVPAGISKEIKINCRILPSAAGKVVNNVEITNVASEYVEPSGSSDSFDIVLGVYDDDDDNDNAETSGAKTGDTSHAATVVTFFASALFLIALLARRKHRA